MSNEREIAKLKKRIEDLEKENSALQQKLNYNNITKTVIVPEKFRPVFNEAENHVRKYFSDAENVAENGEIIISGERYVLIRSAALSYEFLDVFKEFYSNKSPEEASRIGNNFLFDIAHVLGTKDAKAFHKKMKLTDPIQKLSAGPVHFAFTGWANVEIFPESNPSPDENFFMKYYHHNSFEAQAWIKAGRKSKIPVCTMNCGYSSGWCEESFGIPLTAVEIECEAQGADHCTFIMAPPDRIKEHLQQETSIKKSEKYEVPIFFERKYNEDQLRESLAQKETLLKEVHHRVKNNLQVISSLLNLQKSTIEDKNLQNEFTSSIMRVNTMARIHEMIYGDKNLSSINIEKYFSKLLRSLHQIYDSTEREVDVHVNIEVPDLIFYPDKAIPLGLILNEIACNTFKYAFEKGEKGTFYLSLTEENGKYLLIVGDNGKGLPDNVNQGSLGLSLIPILCDQIDADLDVINSSKGLEYRMTFDH